MSGRLLVLSAPSGAGKSTIAGMLLAKYPQFELSISYTTRAPRGAERHGTHYFFTTPDEFQAMVSRGEFLEYAHVFNKYDYGTARSSVEARLAAGRHVLFDIDVQGAHSLKKIYGSRCTTVFVLPPSFEELANRLRGRKTESEEAVRLRLETAKTELAQAPSFDYRIINQELESSFQELEDILKKEAFV